MNVEQIEKEFRELCDRQRDALLGALRLILAANQTNSDAPDLTVTSSRALIADIKAKEFVSASEAAELFGCSAQHLRNLVQRAIDGKANEPIPFRDLDGVIVFPLSELVEWSRKPKHTAKPRSRKNKTHLKAVAS